MGNIYLIRHGQASFGADDYDVLSPTGIRQAESLGKHLAALDLSFVRCLSGSLQRQRHTATTALQQMRTLDIQVPELEIDEAFNEFDADAVIRALLPGLLTEEPEALHILRNAGRYRAEFQRLFAKLIRQWVSGEVEKPGLQSWRAFVEQVQQGLQRVLERAGTKQNIAIFTSGGTITALVHLITQIPPESAFELNWQIVNTSLSQLKFRDTEVCLASFNCHTHLQLLKNPELITYR